MVMKLLVVISLLTTICLFVAACKPGEISVSGITVLPGTGQYLFHDSQTSASVTLKSVKVEMAVTDRDYMDLRSGIVRKGQPCLAVSGVVEGQLETSKYIILHAVGHDREGNEVSHTLDAGPITGVISLYLTPGAPTQFRLHLTAASNVVTIELKPSSQLYDFPPP